MVIIGAGLSGLASAHELLRAGYDVMILEASMRSGGRVLTQRDGFLDGLHADLGATLVPSCHEITIGYVKEFGLALDPLPNSAEMATLYHFKKKTYVESEKSTEYYPEEWRLTKVEEQSGLDKFQDDYFRMGFPEIGDPNAPGWLNSPGLKRLDAITYEEYLRRKGASDTAIRMEMAVEGSDGRRVSAAMWLAQAYLDRGVERYFQIRGGMDLLPAKFAASLGDRVRYGAAVREVRREGGKTFVAYRLNSQEEAVEADAVICTASPYVLRKIRFTPGLAREKQSAIDAMKMCDVTKITMAMKERFWLKSVRTNALAMGFTDTPVERVWDMSINQPGKSGVLLAYGQGANSRVFHDLPESRQVQKALGIMEDFLPGTRRNFVSASSHSWQDHEWIGGGWVSYTTGQLPLMRFLAQPDGNIFFAGDHTSLRCAWMQGAFESAHRAVKEVASLLPYQQLSWLRRAGH